MDAFPKREDATPVPIPGRRGAPDLHDFGFELELCARDFQMPDQTSLYGRAEHFRMDDDDIFQVDKADLIQGPTLAELNANDDTLLLDLNFDDLLLPEDGGYYVHIGETMAAPSIDVHTPQPRDQIAFSPGSTHSSLGSPQPLGLQELLASTPKQTLPPLPHVQLQRRVQLSSSAPSNLSFEQIWQRREPRKHLLSTGSLAEAGSTSSLSTGGVLSPGAHEDLSQDEESDEDSDRYEDFSSDGESDGEDESKSQRKKPNPKGERYFWQYNLQAKGPKGQRLVLKTKLEDPHVLNEVTDPVFSPSCSLRGIKHSGKARKGDGNDLTPNPRKLYLIGKELDNLGKIINDMTPVSELPFNVRPKTRKEKNKLASRACRLKKKAQHEANKLKLYGLQQEHKQLINGISQMKQMIVQRCIEQNSQIDLNSQVEKIVKSATKVKIAGQSSEFVNKILDKIKSGVSDGGIGEI